MGRAGLFAGVAVSVSLRLLMKTLRFVVAPTRNRRLNELLGLLMLVAAALLLLSIVSYRPTDPRSTRRRALPAIAAVHNWAGVVGAAISDLLLQVEGVTALWFPVLLGMLGILVDAVAPGWFSRGEAGRRGSDSALWPGDLRT